MLYKPSKERTKSLYDRIAHIYDLRHHLQTLWADDIHREEIVKASKLEDGDIVLDIGSGTCLTTIKALENKGNVKVTVVDISEHMLKHGRINLKKRNLEGRVFLMRANVEELPFEDNIYDKVISTYGFGGVQNLNIAIEELVRVAKPNARITMAEMSEVPKDYSKFLQFVHNKIVRPIIRYRWEFRDLNLIRLFLNAGIGFDNVRYFKNRIFGSTMLVSGIVKK